MPDDRSAANKNYMPPDFQAGQRMFLVQWVASNQALDSAPANPKQKFAAVFKWNRQSRDLNIVKFWDGEVSRCRSSGAGKSKGTVRLQRYRP